MKKKYIFFITATVIISYSYSFAAPVSFDGNCLIGCKEDEKKENRFIASYINLIESDSILIFRVNDKIKSIFLSPAVKWEFAADSPVKNIIQLKENKGACIAIDYDIQKGKRSAKRIKILPDNQANKYLTVKYQELENLIKNKAVLIDSRPADIFASGSIPGAVNISLAKLRDDSGKKLLPEDKNTQLVFFCDGLSCRVSHESALIAVRTGYRNVKIFPGGFPEYRKNNNIYSIQAAYLQQLFERKKSLILIDVRKNADEEHIPGAFAADKAKIDDLKVQLPQKENQKTHAMIIVYASGEEDEKISIEAAKAILSWGYRNVTVLDGGFRSYIKTGLTEKKKLLKKIVYKDEESNFITTNEFFSGLLKNSYKDYIFIDLRDERDINEEPGISALGALRISLEKLDANQPKNKFKHYIIYSDSYERSFEAMEMMNMDNFKHVKIIKGYIFSDGKGGLLIGDRKADSEIIRKLKQ